MRISVLTFDFPPTIGGVQQYLYEIFTRIARQHSVTILTPTEGLSPVGTALRRIILPSMHPFTVLRALQMIASDRVVVGHAHPRLLLPAAMFAPQRYATITYGNDYLAAQRAWHRPLFNWLLRRSHPLITITHANAMRLARLGVPNALVVRPGTDPDRFTPVPLATTSGLTLLTVSRLVPRKGIDAVLTALPVLRRRFPHLRYRIVGEGPERSKLEAIANDLGISQCVEFLGKVPDHDLPELYRSAHIFVMPTREEKTRTSIEGFGIVYLEASASGLPIVATDSGGVREAVLDGQTGILVPAGDQEALTRALEQMLEDQDLRARLGRTGRQWVEQEMNWDRAAEDMISALGLNDV